MTPVPYDNKAVEGQGGSRPIKKLDRKNREWSFYSDTWELLSVLYEGGAKLRANVDKFVVRRPKELYDVFYERIRRLTYQDILQACISWHLSKMFQEEPVVVGNTKNKDFDVFLSDCDHSGTSFNKFSRTILETMMLYRRAFILVDKPKADAVINIVTRQDEVAAGVHMPYLVVFDPRSVINWGLDKYGCLDWIVIKSVNVNQEDAFSDISVATDWMIYDKTNYYRYQFRSKTQDGDSLNEYFDNNRQLGATAQDTFAELVDTGPHVMADQNCVPIHVCELPTDLWHANRAFLHLLEHVDMMNAYSWKLFMANLPQLVVYSEEEPTAKTLTESGFMHLGVNDKIEWLEPKGSSFQESRAHLGGTRQEIYRAFHLQAQAKDSNATADGSSGYSKEVEMAPAVDILNALGDHLRGDLQCVLNMTKQVGGWDPEKKADVNGFQFETKPTLAAIEKYQAGLDSGIIQKSETLERTAAKDIAMAIVDGKNAELKQKISDEIDKSPPTPISTDPKAPGPGLVKSEFDQRDARAAASGTIKAETGLKD